MDATGYFMGIEPPEREADESFASNAEVKNMWSYAFIPYISP
jgi:hypothetical protein